MSDVSLPHEYVFALLVAHPLQAQDTLMAQPRQAQDACSCPILLSNFHCYIELTGLPST